MKTSPVAILIFFVMCCLPGLAYCGELPSKEVKLLVQGHPDGHSDQSYVEKWRQEVKSKKGITQDLLLMIKQEKDWELIGGIFDALKERSDLTPGMMEELKHPLNNIFSKDPQADMLSSNYACGVIGLLSNFPTSENERLLLSILDKHDGYYNFCVFSSLASIGTTESLPALKSKLAYFNYPSGGGGDIVVSLEHAIKSIEKRINANQRQAASKNRRQGASPGSENSDGKVSTEINSGLKKIHLTIGIQ